MKLPPDDADDDCGTDKLKETKEDIRDFGSSVFTHNVCGYWVLVELLSKSCVQKTWDAGK